MIGYTLENHEYCTLKSFYLLDGEREYIDNRVGYLKAFNSRWTRTNPRKHYEYGGLIEPSMIEDIMQQMNDYDVVLIERCFNNNELLNISTNIPRHIFEAKFAYPEETMNRARYLNFELDRCDKAC